MSDKPHNEGLLFEIWTKNESFIRFDVYDFKFYMVPKSNLITIDKQICYHDICNVNNDCWNNLLDHPKENVHLSETIWEITKILSRRKYRKKISFLVEWKSMNGRVYPK